MAAGIMRILHQRGVHLPQQPSLPAFDEDGAGPVSLSGVLTTMHYPVEQMARCAAQLAIQLYLWHSRRRPAAIISMRRTGDPRLVAPYFSR